MGWITDALSSGMLGEQARREFLKANSGIHGELHEERPVRDGAAAAATQLTLFPEYVACPSCDGQGRFPSLFQEVDCANAYVRCGLCDGTGEVISMFYSKRV